MNSIIEPSLTNQTCSTSDYLVLIPQTSLPNDCVIFMKNQGTPNDTNSSINEVSEHCEHVETNNCNTPTINEECYEIVEECFNKREENRVSIA